MSVLANIPDVTTRRVASGDVTGVQSVVDALVNIVSQHGTLYEWAAE